MNRGNLEDDSETIFNTDRQYSLGTSLCLNQNLNNEEISLADLWPEVHLVKREFLKNLTRKNLEIFIESATFYATTVGKELKTHRFALLHHLLLIFDSAKFHAISAISAIVLHSLGSELGPTITDYPTTMEYLELPFNLFFLLSYSCGFTTSDSKSEYIIHWFSISKLLCCLPVFSFKFLLDIPKFFIFKAFYIVMLVKLFGVKNKKSSTISFDPNLFPKLKSLIFLAFYTLIALSYVQAGGNLYIIKTMSLSFTFDSIIFHINKTVVLMTLAKETPLGTASNLEEELINNEPKISLRFIHIWLQGFLALLPPGYIGFIPSAYSDRIVALITNLSLVISFFFICHQYFRMKGERALNFNSDEELQGLARDKSVIVLSGYITYLTISGFLEEFFHKDHGNSNKEIRLIVIHSRLPDERTLRIMRRYRSIVSPFLGNLQDEHFLEKLNLKKAIFYLFANMEKPNKLKIEDYENIIAAKTIHAYDITSTIYLQLRNPMWNLQSWVDSDWNIDISAIKNSLLANNAINQGILTVVCNLISSFSNSDTLEKNDPSWFSYYARSCIQKLSLAKDIKSLYRGKSFHQALLEMYQRSGVLLIGIRRKNLRESKQYSFYQTLLNPIKEKLRDSDQCIVIANFQEQMDLIWNERKEELEESEPEAEVEKFSELLSKLITETKPAESKGMILQEYIEAERYELRNKIHNHILVFGPFEDFLMISLQLRQLSNQYICYVSERAPDSKDLERIKRNILNAFYLQCGFEKLENVAIETCSHVVLLKHDWKDGETDLGDNDVLKLVKILQTRFPSVHFTIELSEDKSIRVLNSASSFAFNQTRFPEPQYSPLYCASSVFLSSVIPKFTAMAYFNPCLIDIISKLCLSYKRFNFFGIKENISISQIEIPYEEKVDITYGKFFQLLNNKCCSVLPIAVYRSAKVSGNEHPFIITNPRPNFHLEKGDVILLIGRLKPEKLPFTRIKSTFKSKLSKREATKERIQQETIEEGRENLFEICKRLIAEDENFDLQDPELVAKFESESSINAYDRKILLEQNEELLSLLQEFNDLNNIQMKK